MKRIPVREFMDREPAVATPDMLVTRLVALLAEHGVRGVPVIDGDRHVIGVVSATDLFLKEKGVPFSMGEKAPSLLGEFIDSEDVDAFQQCKEVTVREVMTRTLTSVSEETTLEEVSMLMLHHRLTMVPVMTQGRLVGVVRRIDVLKKMYAED